MGTNNKYYLSSESDWQTERKELENVEERLDILQRIDKELAQAFELINDDRYGEMESCSYDSQASRIQKCKEKNEDLLLYVNQIENVLGEKEYDFHRQLSQAMESLSMLDIEKYEVDNTLGIEEWATYNTSTYIGTSAYNQAPVTKTTVKTKKSKITFADIQTKTDMMGVKNQFEKYLKKNKIDEKKLTDVELSTLKDQFYTQAFTTSFEHTVYNNGWLSGISTSLDCIPVVGGVKNIIEGIAGKTMTGEELPPSERLQYGLVGFVSAGVDAFTFGSATAAKQGTKTIAKEFGKLAMKDVAMGWAQNIGSNALSQLNLPPQLAFMANFSISRNREIKITKLSKKLGLKPNQVEDLVKYSGESLNGFKKIVENGNFGDIIKRASGADSLDDWAKYMSPEDARRYNQYWDDVAKGLDTDTRVKLNQWQFRPDADLYNKYKEVYNNPLYYNQTTGKINWPVDDGFSLGTKIEKEIAQDTIFKRYGENSGEFLGNVTDSFESRALAPHSEGAEVHYYQLTENYKMTKGEAAPWFGSEGGAEQFVKYKPDGSKYTIKELEESGILEDITDLVERGEIKID